MKNLKKFEKSRGIVVFALNSETVDYVKIADQTSKLARHYLKLPITLITDSDATPMYHYDKIIKIEQESNNLNYNLNLEGKQIIWYNFGRYLVYKLTPYDETILLDTDYLILDNSLLTLWNTDFDYKLMHHNNNLEGKPYHLMGVTSVPYVWATVVLFRKSLVSKIFFDLVEKIQRNYQYYRKLYNIRERNFRNDYAFAIANIVLNGYDLIESQGIPWPMQTINHAIDSIRVNGNKVVLRLKDNNSIITPLMDLHVMDKTYLQNDNFKKLVGDICEQ